MGYLKELIRKSIPNHTFQNLRKLRNRPRLYLTLVQNFHTDMILFLRHSNVFTKNSYSKLESLIILRYHSLEKGFLHKPIRFKFGRLIVVELIDLLKNKKIINSTVSSQIEAAYLSLCTYYDLHTNNHIDISDFFSKDDYLDFKNKISSLSSTYTSTINHDSKGYFNDFFSNFADFSNSRSSVRNYTGELIGKERIKDVVQLAKNAPSVCNRQPVKVYLLENKKTIKSVLELQGGLKGYDANISQLLIITSDRSSFYTIGERNQLYIDGGIFLMNLLYSLHFFKIACCPANWGMTCDKDKKIRKVVDFPIAEKIISLVSIGVPVSNFSTCLSLRKSNDEILRIIK